MVSHNRFFYFRILFFLYCSFTWLMSYGRHEMDHRQVNADQGSIWQPIPTSALTHTRTHPQLVVKRAELNQSDCTILRPLQYQYLSIVPWPFFQNCHIHDFFSLLFAFCSIHFSLFCSSSLYHLFMNQIENTVWNQRWAYCSIVIFLSLAVVWWMANKYTIENKMMLFFGMLR